MTKRLLLLLLGLMSIASAFSQSKKFGVGAHISNPIRETQVRWFGIDTESLDGHDFVDNSIALDIIASYKKSNSVLLRLRVGMTRIDLHELQDFYTERHHVYSEATGRQNKLTIAPGITWTFGKNKIEGYMGFESPLTLHGEYTLDSHAFKLDTINGGTIYEYKDDYTIPRGFSVGLGAVTGFSFFVSPGFSFNAEVAPSLVYARYGGTVTGTLYHVLFAQDPNIDKVSTEHEIKTRMLFENRFSLGMSVWF